MLFRRVVQSLYVRPVHPSLGRFSFIILGTFVTVFLPFQNCSRVGFQSEGSSSGDTKAVQGGSGGGFDGKVYRSYAECPDGKRGIGYRLLVAKDKSAAFLSRENCEDLKIPKSIKVEDIRFSQVSAGGMPPTLVHLGRAYDEDVPGDVNPSAPRITTPVCWGTTANSGGGPGNEFEFMAVNDSVKILGQLSFGGRLYPNLDIYYSSAISIEMMPPAAGAAVTSLSVTLASDTTIPRIKFTLADAALSVSPVSVDQDLNCGTQFDGRHGLSVFSHTGEPQTFTLPEGANRMVTIKAWGAGGGSANDNVGTNYNHPGGAGALVVAQRLLQPGETLRIDVGGGGAQGTSDGRDSLGGFGGGGNGTYLRTVNAIGGPLDLPMFAGGGGGGATSILSNGNTPLIVAAGGGGGGQSRATDINDSYAGGNGGAPNSVSLPLQAEVACSDSRVRNTCLNGLGASVAAPGAAPPAIASDKIGEMAPENGRPFQGGSAVKASGRGGGGGGGGGYFGGGGGTSAGGLFSNTMGGGGGGSSFANQSAGVINPKFFSGVTSRVPAGATDIHYPKNQRVGVGGRGLFSGESGGHGYVVISW